MRAQADLLIREAQYTEEEYKTKKDWGHSTVEDALSTAAKAKVGRLALFHHDPMHDDGFLDQMMEDCQETIRAANSTFACFVAKEGETIEL